MPNENITLVKDAIHNPNEPRHFMQVVPAAGVWVASRADRRLAESSQAVVVKEVGRNIYDAVVYFPRDAVNMDALVVTKKTTHCPLKGDTEYFDLVIDGERIPDAAWSYVEMILGDELKDLIAFNNAIVTVTNL